MLGRDEELKEEGVGTEDSNPFLAERFKLVNVGGDNG